MLFAIHDEDGRITQANKLYDDQHIANYRETLSDRGYLSHEKLLPHLISPDHHWVCREYAGIAERPIMNVIIDKTIIKAGTDDAAIIRGIPKGSRVTIEAVNTTLHDFKDWNGEELELGIYAPSKQRVVITKWPYRDITIEIEGIA